MPRSVGEQRALGLLYTGRSVNGTEAATMGLCDRVAVDRRAAAVDFANSIADSVPRSLIAIRTTMRRAAVAEFSAVLEEEVQAQTALLGTADFAEGVAAVVQNRSPRFTCS